MPAFAIIVPCRLESTRFPRKLLHPIKGKPLVLWVAERITEQAPDYPLWFAVDHPLLAECIEGAGFRAIMTDAAHQSGTDRIAEANRTVRASYVINVQADEPLVTGAQLQALGRLIQGECPMATLCTPFQRIVDFYNVNQVSLRQTVTPDRLLGRMSASMRFLVWGTIPLGAFASSGLSTAFGVLPTLVIGLAGALFAWLWIFFSPVRTLKAPPQPIDR